MYKFDNLNQALIGMSYELKDDGVKRKTRGFDCIEIPHPVLICIENPTDRYITIKERKWNKFLPFVESLWLALGLNDLDVLPGNYVKNLYNFSDNGRTWRAGYGPRMRGFSGHNQDYDVSNIAEKYIYSGNINIVDQFKFVIETLKKDINSRQALITIHDPAKDDFDYNGELKITKDQPCTRSIHFQLNVEGELDCIVDMRSNDILWGFSAVNVFNFTFMQEYIANILDINVGKYYHKADNFHFYDNFKGKIDVFSDLNIYDYPTGKKFVYESKIESLENFDNLIYLLFDYENKLRIEGKKYIIDLENDLFNDWAKVFYLYHTKEKIKFINPYLNKLFYD